MRTSSLSPIGRMLVTTFGLGLLRPAPGTWGSMPPVALAGVFVAFIGTGASAIARESSSRIDGWHEAHWLVYHMGLLLIGLVFSAACLRYGDAAEAHFNKKDPGSVCADETAGVCFPLMLLPGAALGTWWEAVLTLVVAFLAFRVFDIIKLPPANGLQRNPGGLGILLDDLAAGVQAMIAVQLFVRMVL